METTLIKIAQLLLSLSILVFVHELGHYMFARLFKVRVDRFFLFFHPRLSIFKAKKINGKWETRWFNANQPEHLMEAKDENGVTKTDKKGNPIMIPAPIEELDDNDWRKHPDSTEWGIGWLPLGGYCKIAGMIDESMDTNVMNSPAQHWEYRAQKAWKRLLIIVGGVLMNFIAAIVIYGMILFTWGKEYIPMENAYMGYEYCKTAQDFGFVNGDIILSADGEKLITSRDAMQKIMIEGKEDILILRDGKELKLHVPNVFGEKMLEAGETQLMTMRLPFVIKDISEGSAAMNANLQKGDSIIGVNDVMAADYASISRQLTKNINNTINIHFIRNGERMSSEVSLEEDGILGVQLVDPNSYFKVELIEYGFFQSIPAGAALGYETLANYIKQFRLVFTKAGAESVGGFIAIGNIFPAYWNWNIFWNMTALLSIMLAFMNILPIPILDGGYVLFIIYEILTGKKPSDKFMEIALNIGMFLLLALLIFANGNDIIKLFN